LAKLDFFLITLLFGVTLWALPFFGMTGQTGRITSKIGSFKTNHFEIIFPPHPQPHRIVA
jgi:hypothetical protein